MTKNPLLFLAHVALDTPAEYPVAAGTSGTLPHLDLQNHTNTIHIPRVPNEHTVAQHTDLIPLKRSITSNGLSAATSGTGYEITRRRKPIQRSVRLQKIAKAEIRARRRENMERAVKIRSLENSPVNEQQLSVLRMVFDEITMYPIESWMAVIAIAIHRAFKQVKNWFSNERQKHKAGHVVSVYTDTGDKVRLRPLASQLRPDWSDKFFEEVVMIYHYKIHCNLREAQLTLRTTI